MDRRTFLAAGMASTAFTAYVIKTAVDAEDGGHFAGDDGLLSSQDVVPQSVSVSEFGSGPSAIGSAIDTGAREIVIDTDVTVMSDISLRSDQVLRFAGGKIIVPDNARITNAVLHNRGGKNIVLINPVIDARAEKGGVSGIKLFSVSGVRIQGGQLTRANLHLESSDTSQPRDIQVSDLTIDMDGYANTAVYLGGICGVTIRRLRCFGGHEGVGIYNNARSITLSNVASYNHVQDGFLVNSGQDVSHVDCEAHGNGQSGFTTQRQNTATDTLRVSWTGCKAWDNVYDGFDIRGANTKPWGFDTLFALSACTARGNRNCGFYVVNAEGTTLDSCVGILNFQQNLFIDNSDRVTATGFRSVSGASKVASGPNKAGILVYNSDAVQIRAPVSGNGEGVTQDHGLAFTGTSKGGLVIGGNLSGNQGLPLIPGSNAVVLHRP